MNFEETLKYYFDHGSELKVTDPVVIPTMGNREKILVRDLSVFRDAHVMIFCYADDFEKSGYDKIEFPSNVEVIKMDVPWHSLRKKLNWIQHYMEDHGYERYIKMDDDISPIAQIKNPSTEDKRKRKVPLYEALAVLQNVMENCNEEWYFAGVGSDISVTHAADIFTHGTVYWLHYVNCANLKKIGLYYTEEHWEAEDVIMNYELKVRGLHTNVCNLICVDSTYKQDTKNSMASPAEYVKRSVINDYRHCKGYIKIFWDHKSNLLRTNFRIKPNVTQWEKDMKEIDAFGDDFEGAYAMLYEKCKNEYLKKEKEKAKAKAKVEQTEEKSFKLF